ncbi:hypothetical protein ABIC50_006756 [Burkholderia sp. 567]
MKTFEPRMLFPVVDGINGLTGNVRTLKPPREYALTSRYKTG